MGMTMTQKILAAHAGLDEVKAGQLIMANLDLVLGNDVTSPVAINEFNKAGFTDVFDKNKVTMVMDHFAPNKDIKSATQCKTCRDFASKYDIKNYFDVGDMGIEHALLPEKDLSLQATALSVLTHILVHMAHLAHSQQVSAQQICAQAWQRERPGSKSLPLSSSIS